MNGIILAGGKSSRFGENKAFIEIDNKPLIERNASLLASVFSKVYIVTNSLVDFQHLGVELVTDIFKNCGPMGGIHAGLIASDSRYNFIAACDMPFLNIGLIRDLSRETADFDLVVPKFEGKPQMLHAFYSKNCLSIIKEQLTARNLRLQNLADKVNSKIIDLENFGQSFVNINTQEEYKKACIEPANKFAGSQSYQEALALVN